MKMKILKMELQHFKGIRNASFEFDDVTDIFSKNGVGKTTIADAFYWLFGNRSYELISKPNVTPQGLDEIESVVEITISIENVEYVCRKAQRTENKDKDGITKSKTTNHYAINGVEKSENQFKNYLKELGFDFDNFLFISNPNAFITEKQKDARAFLMSMCHSQTDFDIALKTLGASDLTELLEKYSLEEVEAMQKSSIKKINERIGKDGELIDAKINGFESAKNEVNVSGLADRKIELEKELDDLKDKQKELFGLSADKKAIEVTLQELKDEFIAVRNKIKSDNNKEYYELRDRAKYVEQNIDQLNRSVKQDENRIAELDKYIEQFTNDIDEIKSVEFTNTTCPTCNQPLPEEQLKTTKEKFAEENEKKIEYDNEKIGQNKREKDNVLERLEENKSTLAEYNKEKNELNEKLVKLEETRIKDVGEIDYTQYGELKSIVDEIEEKKKMLSGDIEVDGIEIVESRNKVAGELDEVNHKLAQYETNKKIDSQIEEHKKEKITQMQLKANAEKMLHQIDVLKKAKNEIVVDEVNSNFELVKWKLFDYYKNGEYKEICEPTIDDKNYTQEVNTALQMRARLDIVKGLQKYFDSQYPVFVDNAECLDIENKKKIDLGTQIIFLTVSEDTEIRIVNKENEDE